KRADPKTVTQGPTKCSLRKPLINWEAILSVNRNSLPLDFGPSRYWDSEVRMMFSRLPVSAGSDVVCISSTGVWQSKRFPNKQVFSGPDPGSAGGHRSPGKMAWNLAVEVNATTHFRILCWFRFCLSCL